MNLKKLFAFVLVLALCAALLGALAVSAFAAEEPAESAESAESAGEGKTVGTKAIAAAVVVGIVAAAGAIGMALAISKSTEGMARQPEAAGKINSAMMLGLVFIETTIIYALIVAILIIFVL
ncbi:MAG: ATP synthase F0 subunit C [Ruminococcaceae bacterium]|nr:ATP synthase F0 subunit C [Oscillospiraceae bacterium]